MACTRFCQVPRRRRYFRRGEAGKPFPTGTVLPKWNQHETRRFVSTAQARIRLDHQPLSWSPDDAIDPAGNATARQPSSRREESAGEAGGGYHGRGAATMSAFRVSARFASTEPWLPPILQPQAGKPSTPEGFLDLIRMWACSRREHAPPRDVLFLSRSAQTGNDEKIAQVPGHSQLFFPLFPDPPRLPAVDWPWLDCRYRAARDFCRDPACFGRMTKMRTHVLGIST